MKKTSRKANRTLHIVLLIAILPPILSLFIVQSAAQEIAKDSDVYSETDGILSGFEDVLPDGYEGVADLSGASESLGVKRLLEWIFNAAKNESGELSAFLLTLLGIGLFSSLASLPDSEVARSASGAVGAVSCALLFGKLVKITVGAVESLRKAEDFFTAVIPVCLAVNSMGVSPTTASTQALGMGLTLSIYSYLCESVIMPIVIAVFVTSSVASVDGAFSSLSKGIKGVFFWVMGIFTALIGATFSLQSVLSTSADNALLRSARYAVGTTVPIVGGAVSSALGLVTGAAAYARSVVGGGAVAVMVALIISPLVTLLLYRISLKLGVFFASVISSDGCAGVLSSFLGALDVLIAAYAITSVVYTVELVAFLKGGCTIA